MKRIISLFVLVILLAPTVLRAQFSQDKPKAEPMFKIELGYMPFVMNVEDKPDGGYYAVDGRHMPLLAVSGGANLSQDFFVGLGAGYGYMLQPHNMIDNIGNGWHTIMAYADFDYRSLSMEFSPMVYAKGGVSYMMSDTPDGNTLAPYAEAGIGLNWFFNYRYDNMERNYRSLYLTIGFTYTQRTAFFPVRLGLRF